MAVQEEPKEPHVTSVLPWVILYRVIRQEEDAFRSLCHQQQLQSPADEGTGPQGPASSVCVKPPACVGSGDGSVLDGGRGTLYMHRMAGVGP